MAPGGLLTLCVSTDAERFSVTIYRQAGVLEAAPIPGIRKAIGTLAPINVATEDFGWPEYTFSVPKDCTSGVYIALLSESYGDPDKSSQHNSEVSHWPEAAALFVVRPDPSSTRRRPTILYKVPLFTYHAYHVADYDVHGTYRQCLYTGTDTVSLRRPGGGVGAMPWDVFNEDVYDLKSPRHVFGHWDAKFISWMHAHGFQMDYCTDLDMHSYGNAILKQYSLLVSAGHDEYWSDEMRLALEDYVANGGNVAFFGGNTAWARVTVDDYNLTIKRSGQFPDEERFTGVSFREAGGKWHGGRLPIGYTVQHSDHWVYEGTGLRDGDTFGSKERLVGYECDGTRFDRRALHSQVAVAPDFSDNAPSSLQILGFADLSSWGVSEVFNGIPVGDTFGNRAATMTIYGKNGTVFNAATVDWPRVLHQGEPTVERITANVIRRLS